MDPRISYLGEFEKTLAEKRDQKQFTAYRIGGAPDWTVHIRSIGKEVDPKLISELKAELGKNGIALDSGSQKETYYLLSNEYSSGLPVARGPQPDSDLGQELRPGSGILRFVGGEAKGPAGTLTCFLASEDGSDIYLLAAGHVVSDFWQECPSPHPKGSIYHNPKGFPSTGSTRFIGKMVERSKPPLSYNNSPGLSSGSVKRWETDIDVSIVSVLGEFEWKQRTTCYGTFGEWPGEPERPEKGQIVMKCGSEETHWTYASVACESEDVLVYGPNGVLYDFSGQVILSQLDYPPGKKKCKEKQDPYYPASSFAVPGDSGTMIVDYESRKPLGMLIAGSILEGKYVMTPIKEISDYWKKKGYVFLRA